MRTLLVDIDHVLSDSFGRDPMIKGDLTTDWDAYHLAGKDDVPLPVFVDIINAMHAFDYYIMLFTARPERWRGLTSGWLYKHKIWVDEILMRPDDNYRPATELKMELVHHRFGTEDLHLKIGCVMDDREDVVSMFANLGIPAMQVFGKRKK